jgi:hypothetical protein
MVEGVGREVDVDVGPEVGIMARISVGVKGSGVIIGASPVSGAQLVVPLPTACSTMIKTTIEPITPPLRLYIILFIDQR